MVVADWNPETRLGKLLLPPAPQILQQAPSCHGELQRVLTEGSLAASEAPIAPEQKPQPPHGTSGAPRQQGALQAKVKPVAYFLERMLHNWMGLNGPQKEEEEREDEGDIQTSLDWRSGNG